MLQYGEKYKTTSATWTRSNQVLGCGDVTVVKYPFFTTDIAREGWLEWPNHLR
jgi:hypothetical protein